MAKNLIIVESPAKSKTIEKYLGSDYQVLASFGHLRDLIKKNGAVEVDNNFFMKYETIDRNQKHITNIKKALKKCDNLLLATDPDREGEAISWHLLEILKEKNDLKNKTVHRIVFNEITQKALKNAVANPQDIDMNLVNAQQARRALDYLVGFNLSPLLWQKIRTGLSAGRVQSPALRMITEQEQKINAFVAREYWSIDAKVQADKKIFNAKLYSIKKDKVKQFTITDEKTAKSLKNNLETKAQNKITVAKIEKKQRKRYPSPPFTTSTMQQQAIGKLGFSALKTMMVAQQLYEGINGQTGLITYMRTDSLNLSSDAITSFRDFVTKKYGNDYIPDKPNYYKTKSKNAQEAHEAIRPTDVLKSPTTLKTKLNNDQYRLYSLIWQRAVASQMIYATMDTVRADLDCATGEAIFRATGSSIRHAGFLKVYPVSSNNEDDKILPDMQEGQIIDLLKIKPEQHFTEPPPRYSEATLVKGLEEYGIGRPSTYASIISTLQNRNYVEMEKKRFIPTEIGKIVNGFLTDYFTKYVDYDWTAKLENSLDEISTGKKDMLPVLKNFWLDFKKNVDETQKNVQRSDVLKSRILGDDPRSGKPLSVRMGRFGPMAQIGTVDDEEKPKFASLSKNQKLETITFDDAMQLFKLPRDLGESPAGEKIAVNIGRFGPYVRYDDKFVSLPKDCDPYTIELKQALELVNDKKEKDANRIILDFKKEGIQVLNGRYGPFITDGKKNAKIPKDTEPKTLTIEQCQDLIKKAPEKKYRKKAPARKKTTTKKKTAVKKTIKKTSRKK
ncbi:MAG: type I DNA topoisomerase [Gammaproteobacteria bacterium]|nr:MAG: type I DNA topoisomerase [Gammaproteobacteria bacterium]